VHRVYDHLEVAVEVAAAAAEEEVVVEVEERWSRRSVPRCSKRTA